MLPTGPFDFDRIPPIREFEEAVEAQLAMDGVADLLEAAGMADIAGSACARERACATPGSSRRRP